MKKDPKSRALEVCLLRMQAGDSLNQVLSAYPRWISTLQPILEAAQAAHEYSDTIQIPNTAQDYSRQAFLKTAQEMIPRPKRFSWGRMVRRLIFTIFILLLATVAIWQLVQRSTTALPGDMLYGIKRLNEQVHLSLERNAKQRLAMEQANDLERLREVDALIKAGVVGEVEFSGSLIEIEAANWQVSDIQVVVPTDARLIGEINQGFHIRVQGLLQPDGSVIAQQIQPIEYVFQGQIQAINPDSWMVDSLEILVGPQTSILGDPEIGEQVRITLQLTLEETLAARLIESLKR